MEEREREGERKEESTVHKNIIFIINCVAIPLQMKTDSHKKSNCQLQLKNNFFVT